MNLLYLIDRLEEQVAGAQRMPIGTRAIVDRRELLDTIDQLRIAIPGEVREAREIVEEMNAIRRNAEEEARLMVARAEEQATALIDDHKLTRVARQRAAEIVAESEDQIEARTAEANAEMEDRLAESRRLAAQQMAAADEYARALLVRLEEQLQTFGRSVRSGLEQLTGASPDTGAANVPITAGQMNAFLAEAAAAPRSLDEAEQRASSGMRGGNVPQLFEIERPDDPAASGELGPEPLPAEEGVIDDFAMPPLDDERTRVEAATWSRELEPADGREASTPRAGTPARSPAGRTV